MNTISFSQNTSSLGLPGGFMVTCHAGAMKTEANTVASIKKCIETGAQAVEIDVSFRPDGTPVIIHSSAPKMDEGCLLYDALQAVAQSKTCKINLDLKAYSELPEVDRMAANLGLLERVFFTGVPEDKTEAVKNSSIIPYYLNCTLLPFQAKNADELKKYAVKIKSLGAVGMNISYPSVTKTVVEIMHENSLPVSVWTVDDIRIMKKMIGFGVDNITTKRPDKLLSLIEAM